MNALRRLAQSFCFAFRGILRAVRRERNLRIHLCAVCFVILFGLWQRLCVTHWVIELVCCALVIALELVNTALEAACDALCPERHPGIGFAKDACAGAVLAAAIGSVCVWALLLFGQEAYLHNLCSAFSGQLWPRIALPVWALLSIAVVFGPEKTKEMRDTSL